MNNKDGTTEKISRGCNERYATHQSRAMGTVAESRSELGAKSIIFGGENCSRGNLPGGDAYDEHTDIGKILKRLEQLESAYLGHLDTDKSRSEARLGETRLLREQFVSQVAELKQEIYQLAIEEQEVNGNGHKN